ncbi:MAG: NADPH:quinone oxidoreductase family protein [Gammaproteobacteria bacterium]|nr:NADPH:quinone oxidoreductase family protein [Gammaproteobacteria bacterium]
MKALLSCVPGPAETLVLEDLPDPEPGPGEVLIRVAACGLNYPDVLIIEDRYQVRPPRPFAPGAEVAGIVERAGAGVVTPAPGEHVMGVCSFGGLAGKLVMPAARCVGIPAGMPFADAAALQLSYGTARHGLADCGQIAAGETLLVLGAAGGVGLAAVELGRASGARVIAAVSSSGKAQLARAAGAEAALVYEHGPFDAAGRRSLAARFKQACGVHAADVVFDPVGGDYTEAALGALGRGGRLLVVGFPAGIPHLPLNLVLLKGVRLIGVPWGAVVAHEPERCVAMTRALLELYRSGQIRPRIAQRLPLERAGAGIAQLRGRAVAGKIVIDIGSPNA